MEISQKSAQETAVAAIIMQGNEVLIQERPEGKIMAGYWEFPGGKIEAGELPEAALIREMEEELGIRIEAPKAYSFLSYLRDEKHILVLVYMCTKWQGNPEGRDGQKWVWCEKDKLADYRLLPPNYALAERLRAGV